MKMFRCIKGTSLNGRQIMIGTKVQAKDDDKRFDKHPAWKQVAGEAPAPEKIVDVDAPAAGADEEYRLGLIEQAKALGLKPKANTGIEKLTAMLKDAGVAVEAPAKSII